MSKKKTSWKQSDKTCLKYENPSLVCAFHVTTELFKKLAFIAI